MVNAAAVVYVYLEDAGKAISVDDLKEWLQIIDEVVEMKLQYDAASKRTCYSVEFRKPASAQQAVQYLNGSRFKNCVVSIKSRVFSPVSDDKQTTSLSSSGPLASVPASARKRCRESAELPCNHLLPADLQMDQLLVEQLPEANAADGAGSVAALWEKLKSSQEQLVATYRDLDKMKEELAAADTHLAKLLHVHQHTVPSSTDINGAASSFALASRRCLSHQHGISVDAYTPSSVVAFVTTSFGPLSFCSTTIVQRDFFLVLKFVFRADEERFLAATADSGGSDSGLSAKAEKNKALLSLSWCGIDFSITPSDLASLRSTDEERQQTVRNLLS